jgi:hypothetical protein
VDETCPACQHPLRDKKRRVARHIDAYCGKVRRRRTHGWCPRCQQWFFPADRVLGLREDSNASPLVQEMSALLVSKKPAEQAEALSLRVLGRSLSRSTLARQAHAQGEHYQQHQQRMKYEEARRRDEPVGSGAIESTCRQLQCRMKRCGQFWSTAGDEALLCLEMFWRNERWELLFPHAKLTVVSNN